MWASDDKAPWHIAPAVKNIDSFYSIRPFIYYATDTLCTRKGVKTKYEEQRFRFSKLSTLFSFTCFTKE